MEDPMERSNPLQLPAHERSFLLSALQKAGEAIRIWRGRRRDAKVLGSLSEEQILDCYLEAADLNMPALEVPKGLMQKLMSMR
jgi:hypothetical protein